MLFIHNPLPNERDLKEDYSSRNRSTCPQRCDLTVIICYTIQILYLRREYNLNCDGCERKKATFSFDSYCSLSAEILQTTVD